ncbi:hypothetical protein K8I28_10430, partial [bacterium]|nr:hypothetical protein [bacterium]
MNSTWIVLHIPGFYAQVERLFFSQTLQPVVVVAGEGTRALVLSATPDARKLGVHEGMRTETLSKRDFFIIEATPDRYQSRVESTLGDLSTWFPKPYLLRKDFFAAEWTGGDRFLAYSLNEADDRLSKDGFVRMWGIGPSAGVAEIASMTTTPNHRVFVKHGSEKTFLAPLPIEALYDLDARSLSHLKEIGIHTLGQLADVPVVLLREMFGTDGIYL